MMPESRLYADDRRRTDDDADNDVNGWWSIILDVVWQLFLVGWLLTTIVCCGNWHWGTFVDKSIGVDAIIDVLSKLALTFVPELVIVVVVDVVAAAVVDGDGECRLRKLFLNTAITDVFLTFEFVLFVLWLSRLFRLPSVFERGLVLFVCGKKFFKNY